jgi:nucleoside-diphosphate kinase
LETTLIILKPDALQRGLVGRIISRLEDKGLQIAGGRFIRVDQSLAGRLYEPHRGKPFYDGLVRFMTSSPVMVLAVRGLGAIDICRKLMGATFGSVADPGTIRGDFGVSNSFNLVHGSDSPASAERELALFFEPGDLLDYERAIEGWVYDLSSGTAE